MPSSPRAFVIMPFAEAQACLDRGDTIGAAVLEAQGLQVPSLSPALQDDIRPLLPNTLSTR